MQPTATDVNLAFYEQASPGVRDYWRFMAAPRHRVRVIVDELLRNPPMNVIDVGCGGGELLMEIRPYLPNARLAGIDLSSKRIAENRKLIPDCDWYVGDASDKLPEELNLAASFDAVIASEVIEHVDVPDRFLRVLRAIARPGGRLILSTQSGPRRETEIRVGHLRHFTATEISNLLAAAGWEVERVWNTGFPFHDLSKWYANRNPEKSMRDFGGEEYTLWQRVVCALLRSAFRLNSKRRGAQLFAVARART